MNDEAFNIFEIISGLLKGMISSASDIYIYLSSKIYCSIEIIIIEKMRESLDLLI